MQAAVPARTLPTRRNRGRTVALNPNRRAAWTQTSSSFSSRSPVVRSCTRRHEPRVEDLAAAAQRRMRISLRPPSRCAFSLRPVLERVRCHGPSLDFGTTGPLAGPGEASRSGGTRQGPGGPAGSRPQSSPPPPPAAAGRRQSPAGGAARRWRRGKTLPARSGRSRSSPLADAADAFAGGPRGNGPRAKCRRRPRMALLVTGAGHRGHAQPQPLGPRRGGGVAPAERLADAEHRVLGRLARPQPVLQLPAPRLVGGGS